MLEGGLGMSRRPLGGGEERKEKRRKLPGVIAVMWLPPYQV